MGRWLSLYWTWLLPALAVLAALSRLRYLRRAQRRGLIGPRAWRWMLVALAAAQSLIWLTQLALVYSTNFWLPSGGLLAVGLTLVALRAARADVHPGLRGFQRPLPRDGLDLIEREWWASRAVPLRGILLTLPALGLLLYIATHHPARWFEFALLGVSFTAPVWLIPYRRLWAAPLLLAPPLVLLLGQALALRAALPAGNWAAPITGADCTGQMRVVAGSGQTWCVNALTGKVYQFDLSTGVVNLEAHVPEGARVFAANASSAWVQQIPARGLVRVGPDGIETIPVRSARSGAADEDNRLWVIDAGTELSLYAGSQQTLLRSRDGLLNNTANVVKASPDGSVWVGSIGGVSVWRGGAAMWTTFDRGQGVPGAVINLAFAPDGAAWLLWQARPGYGALSDWGVSLLTAEGVTRHLELGPQTGLEAPRTEDALAVDGYGRLWFVTQSIPRREKYLGLAWPTPEAPVELYSLGQFAGIGPYTYGGNGLWQNSFGVAADGVGGILLYNGEAQPWRRWRP
jgi:sugar lactone lactonase YvrE